MPNIRRYKSRARRASEQPADPVDHCTGNCAL